MTRVVVRGGGEVFGGSGQVVSSDGVGVCGDALEEVVDVRLASVAGEFAVQPVERTVVECGGGVGEEVGESAQQGGGLLDRGRRAEPGEQWLPGGEVHHAPGAIEVAARPVGAANGRHREPASREVALHGGLERGGGGVGHDPGDEATFELGGRVAELDDVHLGPEPAGERCGWDRPCHGGTVRVSPQRGEEAVGGRVAGRDHAVSVSVGEASDEEMDAVCPGVAWLVVDVVEAGCSQHSL